MYTFILIVHLFVCIGIILIIMMQSSKGAEMGAVFGGGGSQTTFGSQGPGSFLEKLTTAFAVIFMLTSLSLAIMSGSHHSSKAMMPTERPPLQEPANPSPMQEPGKTAPIQSSETPSAPN